MRGVIAWFAANRVAANVMMSIILAGGVISLPSVKKELFPSITLDVVEIQIAYPGADPETVEEAVCMRVEEAVDGVDNIKSIEATATSGACTVYVTAASNDGTERLQSEIKNRIDGVASFPEEAERPEIRTVVFNERVVSVVIAGQVEEATLARIGRRIRDDVAALPGVTLAELGGTKDDELVIEVPETSLRRYGLTLADVAAAIKESSLDLPAGVLKTDDGDIRLRAKGQAYRSADFAGITVLSRADGTRLRVGDIAAVTDGFTETDLVARFNGEPAAFVDVEMSRGQDMLQITEAVRAYVEARQADVPEGVTVVTWADDSVYLEGRIGTLSRNAIGGLVLVFFILLLVLDLEVAFWAAAGTAVAFLGTLFLMPYLGITLNMLSMFAFILVLGIVVDDAIIVSESIYARSERGVAAAAGAVEGTCLVAKPVIFSVLTTIIAFAPMLFFSGPVGNEIRALPILIITILAFSLFECLLILPAHLSRLNTRARGPNWIAAATSQGLAWLARRIYLPLLERALAARYSLVTLFAVMALLTWSVVNAGWIPMRFEPDVPSDWIEAAVAMPPDAPFERTKQVALRMERAAAGLRRDLHQERGPDEPDLIRHIGSIVEGDRIEMFIETAPSETRDMPVADIARRWRERIGDLPEAEKVEIVSTLRGTGRELQIELSALSKDALGAATAALEQKLSSYEGVHDITDSLRAAEREIEITLRPEARLFGVTMADLARQIRQGYYGEEVQRAPRTEGDLKVVVRYPRNERQSLTYLEAMRIRTSEGVEIPFGAVADIRHGHGVSDIQRKNRRRSVTIEADVDIDVTSANQVLDDLDQQGFWTDLGSSYPDVRVVADEEEEAFLAELERNGAIAVLVIYALMAIAFRSYLQPIVIVSAIPFGFIGAVIGHAMLGLDLSMNSLLGVVAASGVVINDNLVLIDATNRARERGLPMADAIREAGETRFRPILLTSITTFIGLLPMMLERSLQAQFLIPMAVSLAFGVLFATVLTLMLVPSVYLIVEDIAAMRLFGRQAETAIRDN